MLLSERLCFRREYGAHTFTRTPYEVNVALLLMKFPLLFHHSDQCVWLCDSVKLYPYFRIVKHSNESPTNCMLRYWWQLPLLRHCNHDIMERQHEQPLAPSGMLAHTIIQSLVREVAHRIPVFTHDIQCLMTSLKTSTISVLNTPLDASVWRVTQPEIVKT
jgi:hypothetical protein